MINYNKTKKILKIMKLKEYLLLAQMFLWNENNKIASTVPTLGLLESDPHNYVKLFVLYGCSNRQTAVRTVSKKK